MSNKNIATSILLVVVFTAIGFGAGVKYQQKKVVGLRNQIPSGQMQRGFAGGDQNFQRGRNGAGMTTGEVIGVDDRSVTVKMADGSSKIVLLSAGTSINKSAEGSLVDIKNGEKVAVFGTANPDGSLTAQSIQLNPAMRLVPSVSPTNN